MNTLAENLPMHKPLTDLGQWLQDARDGDALGFENLWHHFHREIYSLAYAMVGNREEAADVCQDVFIKFFKALHKLDRPAGIGGWLRRVTLRRCYDVLREKKKRQSQKSLGPDDPYFITTTTPDQMMTLKQGLHCLTPRERAAMVLTLGLGYSSSEVAKMMKCRPATVRTLSFKARKKMNTALLHQGTQP